MMKTTAISALPFSMPATTTMPVTTPGQSSLPQTARPHFGQLTEARQAFWTRLKTAHYPTFDDYLQGQQAVLGARKASDPPLTTMVDLYEGLAQRESAEYAKVPEHASGLRDVLCAFFHTMKQRLDVAMIEIADSRGEQGASELKQLNQALAQRFAEDASAPKVDVNRTVDLTRVDPIDAESVVHDTLDYLTPEETVKPFVQATLSPQSAKTLLNTLEALPETVPDALVDPLLWVFVKGNGRSVGY
ncbi:MAG: hypothetical protein SFZ03_06185 [Candidatus Melainabacteria bacterium]|nr:hypothetical protein [Candidatus Melainabacteria bacterium]